MPADANTRFGGTPEATRRAGAWMEVAAMPSRRPERTTATGGVPVGTADEDDAGDAGNAGDAAPRPSSTPRTPSE